MTFVSVMFLLGTLGVLGPMLVHLFARPRFKRVPFTMLQFLREGQIESKAKRRIRDWIILLLRCVIIALLALLFARPMWETHVTRPAAQAVWFVGLDNSLSMTYRKDGSDLLTQLRSQAKDVIRACPHNTEFSVFLAGSNQWFRHVNQAQALALVHNMMPVKASAQFESFVSTVLRECQQLDEATQVNVLLGSDFSQDVMMGLRSLVTPVGVDQLTTLPVMPDPNGVNAGIVSASVSSVSRTEAQLHVTLRNTGAHSVTQRLTATGSKAHELILLPGKSQVKTLICPLAQRPKGTQQTFQLALEGRDDFRADDEIQLTVAIADQDTRRVLLVDSNSKDHLFLFNAAIESLSGMPLALTWQTRRVTMSQLSHADLAWADTVVLAGLSAPQEAWVQPIKRQVVQGKRLVCFATDGPRGDTPSVPVSSPLWPVVPVQGVDTVMGVQAQPMACEWTHTRAGELLTQYALDRMAFRNTLKVRLGPGARCVWRLHNGEPFVVTQALGQGVVLWVNTSVDACKGPLAKSPAAVAWAQYLLEPDAGQSQQDVHEPWRDSEPVLEPCSMESIEKVTRALFPESRSPKTDTMVSSYVTKQWPLWRPVAWLLFALLLIEPFVAERMRP